jgi:phage tail sheath protein FI
MTDKEMIRAAIDTVKEFAKMTAYEDALDLAKKAFVANPNTHNNWEILDEGIKNMFIKLAEAAIYEITTDKEIK